MKRDRVEEEGCEVLRTPKASWGGAMETLDASVRQRLQDVFDGGKLATSDIDDRAMEQLASLDSASGHHVLDQLIGTNLSLIRNKSAYLIGIISKLRKPGFSSMATAAPAPHSGSGAGSSGEMPQTVQQALDQLYNDNIIHRGALDQRCLEQLKTMNEQVALTAIQRFAGHDMSKIRNVSAFFTSMLHNAERTGVPAGPAPQWDATAAAATARQERGGEAESAKQDRGLEQMKLGVRTSEFHALSVFAPYVPAAAALKLQQLWDRGCKLLTMLDDKAWQLLTELAGREAAALVEEVAERVAAVAADAAALNALLLARGRSRLPAPPAQRQGAGQQGEAAAHVVQGAYAHQAYRVQASMPPHTNHLPHAASMPPQQHHMHHQQHPHHSQAVGGYAPAAAPAAMGASGSHVDDLPPPVAAAVHGLLQSRPGLISYQHFDKGVVDNLMRLPQDEALCVLQELGANDLAQVRNVPAFIMGMCKRYMRRGAR